MFAFETQTNHLHFELVYLQELNKHSPFTHLSRVQSFHYSYHVEEGKTGEVDRGGRGTLKASDQKCGAFDEQLISHVVNMTSSSILNDQEAMFWSYSSI